MSEEAIVWEEKPPQNFGELVLENSVNSVNSVKGGEEERRRISKALPSGS